MMHDKVVDAWFIIHKIMCLNKFSLYRCNMFVSVHCGIIFCALVSHEQISNEDSQQYSKWSNAHWIESDSFESCCCCYCCFFAVAKQHRNERLGNYWDWWRKINKTIVVKRNQPIESIESGSIHWKNPKWSSKKKKKSWGDEKSGAKCSKCNNNWRELQFSWINSFHLETIH